MQRTLRTALAACLLAGSAFLACASRQSAAEQQGAGTAANASTVDARAAAVGEDATATAGKPLPPAQAGPGTESSVDTLAATVIGNYESIESIYCQYTIQFLDTPRRKGSSMQLRYARSGAKWRTVQIDEREGVVSEFTRCCDDKVVYSFGISHRDGGDTWSTVQIQDRGPPAGFNPEDLIGRNLSNVGRSLPDVLNRQGVSRSEVKLPDGKTYPRLSVGGVPTSRAKASQDYDVALTIDPEHDFLVREILITEPANHISSPGWEQRWQISEYKQVLDKKANRQRWFPVRGLLTQGTIGSPDIKMVVETVRLNPPLPDETFTPEFPAGLQFADHTSDGSGKQAARGGRLLEKAADPKKDP